MFSLYPVAEEGREDDRGAYDEQDRTDERHDVLHDLALVVLHLEVDQQGRDDGHDAADGVADVQHVQHHRDGVVVGLGQRPRAPGVVHAAGLGRRNLRDQQPQHGQEQGSETPPISADHRHDPVPSSRCRPRRTSPEACKSFRY